MEAALESLQENGSPNIVTLSNAVTYARLVQIVGSRLLPGFPGAGGDIKDGVLSARFGSNTLFGEIDGSRTVRVAQLAEVFTAAKLRYKIPASIADFHRTHAAFIAPTRHFYTESGIVGLQVARSSRLLSKVASEIKGNLRSLKALTPVSMGLVAKLPKWVIVLVFKLMLAIPFTQDVLLGNHAQSAYAEMILLNKELMSR
jgi:2-dehydropantoate 2-reductase